MKKGKRGLRGVKKKILRELLQSHPTLTGAKMLELFQHKTREQGVQCGKLHLSEFYRIRKQIQEENAPKTEHNSLDDVQEIAQFLKKYNIAIINKVAAILAA